MSDFITAKAARELLGVSAPTLLRLLPLLPHIAIKHRKNRTTYLFPTKYCELLGRILEKRGRVSGKGRGKGWGDRGRLSTEDVATRVWAMTNAQRIARTAELNLWWWLRSRPYFVPSDLTDMFGISKVTIVHWEDEQTITVERRLGRVQIPAESLQNAFRWHTPTD